MVKKSKIAILFIAVLFYMSGCGEVAVSTDIKIEDTKEVTLIPQDITQTKYEQFVEVPFDEFAFEALGKGLSGHVMVGDLMCFAQYETINATIYATTKLFTYNLKSSEIHTIKQVDNKYRIYDYVLRDNGDIIYTKMEFGAQEQDPYVASVVLDQKGEETLLYQAKVYNYLNMPTLNLIQDHVYFLIEEIGLEEGNNEPTSLSGGLYEIDGKEVRNIWKTKAEVAQGNVNKNDDVLLRSWGSSSDGTLCFITTKADANNPNSIVHYYYNGLLKSLSFNERITNATALKDYILVQSDKEESYLIHIESEKKITLNSMNVHAYGGIQIKDNTMVFMDDEGMKYVFQVNEDECLLMQIEGTNNDYLPMFYVNDMGTVYTWGDMFKTKDNMDGLENRIYKYEYKDDQFLENDK